MRPYRPASARTPASLLSKNTAISDLGLNDLARLPPRERPATVARAAERAVRLHGGLSESARVGLRELNQAFGPVGGAR